MIKNKETAAMQGTAPISSTPPPTRQQNYLKLFISIITPLFIGFVWWFFTSSSVRTWYIAVNKPSFNPPSWVFWPVWTLLYILMWIAFYFIWQHWYNLKTKNAFIFYYIQLWLNLLWSIIFFWLHNPTLAFIEIIILWIFILLTIISFYKIEKKSAYLLIPYLLWVSFASILNFYIMILN